MNCTKDWPFKELGDANYHAKNNLCAAVSERANFLLCKWL